jgi:hypothetical protein
MTPLVTAICLTANRQAFTDRAVACFLGQIYANKRLLILDTGAVPYQLPVLPPEARSSIVVWRTPIPTNTTIGELRNIAVDYARDADIIMHWDSDDWSAPGRMSEQIEAIKGTFEVSGYSNMLFWDYERSEAWLYDHRANNRDTYCLGTSLAYRRYAWEQRGFKHTSSGEDLAFCAGRRVISGSSVRQPREYMMLGAIHAGNQGGNYRIETRTDPTQAEWKRLTAADNDARRIMKL